VKRLMAILAAFLLLAVGCDINGMLLSPTPGTIVPTPTITASGVIPDFAALGGTLEVNGVPVAVNPDRTWSVEVPRSPGHVTVLEAIYTVGGIPYRQQHAVVNGPKLDDGQFSPNGVGMFFTNSGLTGLGPVIQSLAAGAFDIGPLLLAQQPLFEDEMLGMPITGNAYEAGLGGVNLTAQSTSTGVATHITVSDLYVGVDMHIGGILNADCKLELQIPTATIDAKFDLRPDPAQNDKVDVNLVGTPTVNTGTVAYEFISGICDSGTFIIGDIVNLVAGPQIQSLVGSAFSTKLGDPDGAGPLDSPIADAIETALGEISIAGAVGEATKANLNAPFTAITETNQAIDFRANADFYPTFGTGPSDCQPPAHAPTLPSSYDVAGTYPTLGTTTPTGGDPYGLGLVVSGSAFNQLLNAMTECGILNQDIHEISLGGGAPLPITSTLLAALVPQFGTNLPPGTPMFIRVKPQNAPFITTEAGPNGESAELVLADLQIEFIENRAGNEIRWLLLGVDAPLGFDLTFDDVAGQLTPDITPPLGSDVTARVLTNAIKANEASVEAIFPNLFPSFVDGIGSSFAAFPLPSFLGLSLDVLEIARHGNYFVLYSELDPIPQTRIQNVTVTDLSSANTVTDSIFDVNEWRHRIRKLVTPNQVKVDFKGMIGADACCSTGDEEIAKHAGYRITLQVVPENGDTWRLDLSHLIRGAHTLLNEQDGGAQTRFDSAITARYNRNGGAWTNFNFNPSVMSQNTKGGAYAPFTGSAATFLTGTTTQTITVEIGFDVFARSESNVIFPIEAGDEGAIRFGANDTITNGFTAGEYPGTGGRSILTDGHFATVTLTTE
jgi:hypothetical protein